MDNNECLICKKHYTQDGRCTANKSNCLLYENEPRGKVKRTSIAIEWNDKAETQIIKRRSPIMLVDQEKEFEAEVIKIIYVDMSSGEIGMEIDYHENDYQTKADKRAIFKVVK